MNTEDNFLDENLAFYASISFRVAQGFKKVFDLCSPKALPILLSKNHYKLIVLPYLLFVPL